MDTYDSNEELDRVKTWWKTYGNAVIFGVVLGALMLTGLHYWNRHKTEQAQAASALYMQMDTDYNQKKIEAVQTAGAQLMKDYAATPYAGKAALYLAKISYERNDLASARAQLQWAIDNGKEPGIKHVARIRLGRILLAANEYDAALRLTAVDDQLGFASAYSELKGDVLLRQGKTEEARAAYRAAREALLQGSAYTRVLDKKLDALGAEAGK